MALILSALFFTIFHACSLDNNMLRPTCKIYKGELVERWWYPQGDGNSMQAMFFESNGKIRMSSADSVTFELFGCNKLTVTNHTNFTEEQWAIKVLSTQEFRLSRNKDHLAVFARTP